MLLAINASLRRLAVHHRLPPDFVLPKSCYSITTCRGSGPGGQGVNSSSSKVELRVNLDQLLLESADIDADIITKLRASSGGSITKGDELIVSSHEHRSAHHNEEACLGRVMRMLREASAVEEPPPPPMEFSDRVRQQAIDKRRLHSNKLKLNRSAKAARISGTQW